jgi:hypothetical protein
MAALNLSIKEMDTRFWGPSGWRLLHLITFSYTPERDKKSVCKLFNTLAYVLPCKYCRASFSETILLDPIEDACADPLTLQTWLWRVHNTVTDKLRKSGLTKAESPPFDTVAKMYTMKLEQGCSRTVFDGWDFLFSIAENHPRSRAGSSSLALQGAPPLEELTTPLLRNRWNVMEPDERMKFYCEFWDVLPKTLPFPEWRKGWGQIDCSSRKETLATLWKVRSSLEQELDLLNKTTYSSLCKLLQSVRSGCSTSNRSRTCRKKKTTR